MQIKFFRSLQVTSDKKPPSLLPASLPAPAAAPAAAVAPKGITQRDERSFFEIAATVKQTAALQQQKEQQLATDRAKLLQAKAEWAEREAQEAAMMASWQAKETKFGFGKPSCNACARRAD